VDPPLLSTMGVNFLIKVGGSHGERGARAYIGVWRSPKRGPGAEPLVIDLDRVPE